MSLVVRRFDMSAEIRASEVLADLSVLGLGEGNSCHLARLPLQDGVDLLVWHGTFAQALELTMRDDSNLIHFGYVLQGRTQCEFRNHAGSEIYEIEAGAGYIHFGPDRLGRFRYQKGNLASVTVMIRPDILASWQDEMGHCLCQDVRRGNCFVADCRGAELHSTALSLNHSFRAMATSRLGVPDRSRLWIEGQGLSLLGLFLESRSAEVGDKVSSEDKSRLLRARDFLLADLGKAPSLNELAASSGLSLIKLKRGFKSVFGNSVYSLFMQERMHEARRRLLAGRATVTEVATDLGYSNVSHFSAAFRKQFGVNPACLKRSGARSEHMAQTQAE